MSGDVIIRLMAFDYMQYSYLRWYNSVCIFASITCIGFIGQFRFNSSNKKFKLRTFTMTLSDSPLGCCSLFTGAKKTLSCKCIARFFLKPSSTFSEDVVVNVSFQLKIVMNVVVPLFILKFEMFFLNKLFW